jgi:hypothetical protein
MGGRILLKSETGQWSISLKKKKKKKKKKPINRAGNTLSRLFSVP